MEEMDPYSSLDLFSRFICPMADVADTKCCSDPCGRQLSVVRLVLPDGNKKLCKGVTECTNCKSYLYLICLVRNL